MNKEIFARGFLPPRDPLTVLPADYEAWDAMGSILPKLLISAILRETFENLKPLSTDQLTREPDLERAMMLLSFFAHAYVWGGTEPADKLPPGIAIPLCEIATKLDRHPVLSYASYALNNWQRLEEDKPIELGNIVLLQNFLGGLDEEWFVLVHVDIEMKAAPALRLFPAIQEAGANQDATSLEKYLVTIVECLEAMCNTLDRMPEHCDPYIYYHRVRPYIHAWKDNPALPDGVTYQGVASFNDESQHFRGETGAQSSIIPAFDALFGIDHQPDPLRVYLMEMREYMPKAHRDFIAAIEQQGAIRNHIMQMKANHPYLRDSYNACLTLLSRFRQTHLAYASLYIQKQHQSSLANPTAIGTGGTPFMTYLRKHKDETLSFLL